MCAPSAKLHIGAVLNYTHYKECSISYNMEMQIRNGAIIQYITLLYFCQQYTRLVGFSHSTKHTGSYMYVIAWCSMVIVSAGFYFMYFIVKHLS